MHTSRRTGTTVGALLKWSALILIALVCWAVLGANTAHADEPGTGARVSTAAGLNVHDVASLDEDTVTAVLANGTPLDVSCLTDADAMTFVKTRTGYVATQYVTGLPADLPSCGDTATEPTPPPTTDSDEQLSLDDLVNDFYRLELVQPYAWPLDERLDGTHTPCDFAGPLTPKQEYSRRVSCVTDAFKVEQAEQAAAREQAAREDSADALAAVEGCAYGASQEFVQALALIAMFAAAGENELGPPGRLAGGALGGGAAAADVTYGCVMGALERSGVEVPGVNSNGG